MKCRIRIKKRIPRGSLEGQIKKISKETKVKQYKLEGPKKEKEEKEISTQ